MQVFWIDPVVLPSRPRATGVHAPQQRAHAAIRKARLLGLIPDLRVDVLPCSDCPSRATVYEHRDYNAPLMVEPVCHPCNTRRRGALGPHRFRKHD